MPDQPLDIDIDLHPLPDASLLAHVVDAHCHPTDSPLEPSTMAALPHRICAMATRAGDQGLVRALAGQYPDKVIPCFGYHPWFTHWLSLSPRAGLPSKEAHYRALFLPSSPQKPNPSPAHVAAFERLLPLLPEPIPLEDVLADIRANLVACPSAMLGEVGLDRVCRVPFERPSPPPYASAERTSGARDASNTPHASRELSPFTIPLTHQLAILEAQLGLAVELRRNVSVHSVRAADATIAVLKRMLERHGKRWVAISVDLHSCGIGVECWRSIERDHHNVFLSLSTLINTRTPAHLALLRAVSPDRILVESDVPDARASAPLTWDMLVRVAEVRGWRVEAGVEELERAGDREDAVGGGEGEGKHKSEWGAVRRLEENWKRFVGGSHLASAVVNAKRKKRDKRQLLLDVSEEEGSDDNSDSHKV